jgi:hypothetical protein
MLRFQIGGLLLSALSGSTIVLLDGGAPFITCRPSAWTVFYMVRAQHRFMRGANAALATFKRNSATAVNYACTDLVFHNILA